MVVHLGPLEELARRAAALELLARRRTRTARRPTRSRAAGASWPRSRTTHSGRAATSRSTSVPLPAPDGPESTSRKPPRLEAERDRRRRRCARGCGRIRCRHAHSTFCTCSRRRSISSFITITARGDLDVVGLGADRVGLAVHLLQQEVELAARQLRPLDQRAELVEVRRQPHALLGAVEAVGHQRHFLRDAGSGPSRRRRAAA